MPSSKIRLEDVCVDVGVRPLFQGVTADFGEGWTAVVGGNGVGKSTLLRLIAGELAPSAGRVSIRPTGARVAVVAQVQGAPSDLELAFLEASDRGATRLRAELRIDPPNDDARWTTLSPGERRRIQIGAALWSEAEVLLRDEADAHLDVEARELLVRAMRAHRGIGVVVSHHRDLLDAVSPSTLWLERGKAHLYEGGYSKARGCRDIERRSARAERDELVRRDAASAAYDLAKRRHEAAQRSESSSSRMKNKNDHDARDATRKGRAEHAASRMGRLEGVLGSKLDRARAETGAVSIEKEVGRAVQFRARPSPDGRVAILTEERICAGDCVVLERTSLVVGARSRVRLEGPNGAGKSTLLAALVARCRPGAAVFLPQVIEAPTRRALRDELSAVSKDERGRWLSLVAALGTDPDQIIESSCPSPGEARKLVIARALQREVSALLLDEPTNDLDLPSIERLQVALARYEGAIVLVTHDDALARAVTAERWSISSARTLETSS